MKLDKETNILIIGLGVIGGSYAMALSRKGYKVSCITKEAQEINFGLEKGMICYGSTEVEPDFVAKSDLIILAARPAMGKTSFALNIAQNVGLLANIPVAIFSLEMSRDQLVQRLLCSEAEIDSHRIRTGELQAKRQVPPI